VTVAAKVSKLCEEFLLARVAVSEMAECSDNFLYALLFIARKVAVPLELGRPGAVLPLFATKTAYHYLQFPTSVRPNPS
jgi:hypothetical protein